MPAAAGAIIALVVGAILAAGTAVAVVQLAGAKPDPVQKPVVVYGQ